MIDQKKVDTVFHEVAQRYDLMNDLMSAGMHRLWKDGLVSALSLPSLSADRRFRILDIAGGSGDISARIADRTSHFAEIVLLDINWSMLEVGHSRLARDNRLSRINLVQADGADLPFADGSFDAVVIAFGIRNIPDLRSALREISRILRRGGQFLCLEFSAADMPVLDRLYDIYSEHFIPALGQRVVGDSAPYEYLVDSIRKFPNRERFAAMIRECGFSKVDVRPYCGGIACLHSGWKF